MDSILNLLRFFVILPPFFQGSMLFGKRREGDYANGQVLRCGLSLCLDQWSYRQVVVNVGSLIRRKNTLRINIGKPGKSKIGISQLKLITRTA
jgi:hypothetical protein